MYLFQNLIILVAKLRQLFLTIGSFVQCPHLPKHDVFTCNLLTSTNRIITTITLYMTTDTAHAQCISTMKILGVLPSHNDQ